ncbi:hypothetical protein VJY32_02555 [Ignavibacteria bacterium 4148-Me]|uniref:hypothetical protein n=1 Tax=Rosettibacter primus TaxID=3111523 RepID=UPI00336BD6A0
MPTGNFHISTEINFFYLIPGIIILLVYSYFIYKYTIPKVSTLIKTLLVTIRSISILLILILIFEPVLTISYKKINEPKIFLFTDNSKSLAVKDSLKRLSSNIDAIKNLVTTKKSIYNIFTFGVHPEPLSIDSLNKIKYNEPVTNFDKIISVLKNSEDNIAGAVIISDGIITDGSNPIYEAEKLNFPIFTVGIGDSSIQKDVAVKEVLYNQYIYANKETEIEALITQKGFDNSIISASLFEEDKLIQTKNFNLSETGFNKIKFDYTPKNYGEIKLSILISQLKNEDNLFNNKKTFFINVLKDKIKVAIIAGSPSPDLSAVSTAIKNNENIDIIKIIQITQNKIWNDNISKIDSADVLVLIDFPAYNSTSSFSQQIFSKIEKNNKPYLMIVSNNTDMHQLSAYEKVLPFSINNISNTYIEIAPSIFSSSIKSIFSKSFEDKEWENLPPLTKSTTELIPKPGCEILVKGTVRNIPANIPLIISMNIGRQKSFAILAGDIWRWQLLKAEKNPYFFSKFLNNIIKWLNTAERQNQFIVKTNKKIFSEGEPIDFIAELYDNTFAPIDSAKINLTVFNDNQKYNLILEKVKDGIFQSNFELNRQGNYSYEATAEYDGITLKSNRGRFSVVESDIEKLNTQMDINFLKQLAYASNGNFYFLSDIDELKKQLNEILNASIKEKSITSEINLRTDKWLLITIIILFSIEWFIRKRHGMV